MGYRDIKDCMNLETVKTKTFNSYLFKLYNGDDHLNTMMSVPQVRRSKGSKAERAEREGARIVCVQCRTNRGLVSHSLNGKIE